jgi:hypothetical protein
MRGRAGSGRLGGVLWGMVVLLGAFPSHRCAEVVEQTVCGSGRLVQETREVGTFASVAFMTSGNLAIEVADREALCVEAEDNLLDLIETEVVDGELVIRHRGNVAPAPTKPLRFHLKVRELDRIVFTGSGNVSVPHLETDRLEIRHSGSGRIDVGELQTDILAVHSSGSGEVACERVNARRCRLIASGSGDTKILHLESLMNDARLTGSGKIIIAQGSVVEQEVFVSGSGEFKAQGLRSTQSEVMVSGCGKAAVHAQALLDATITGSGDIHYRGQPQMHMSVTGSGKLRRL